MPSKKLPQGSKPSQPQTTDNMAMAAQEMSLGPEEKDVSLLIEKISDKILSTLNERFDKLEATLQDIQTEFR